MFYTHTTQTQCNMKLVNVCLSHIPSVTIVRARYAICWTIVQRIHTRLKTPGN